jgi:hypothetical protein
MTAMLHHDISAAGTDSGRMLINEHASPYFQLNPDPQWRTEELCAHNGRQIHYRI